MIGNLARWLEARFQAGEHTTGHAGERRAHDLHLVAAALLVEAARADHHFSDAERDQLATLLCRQFALSPAEADTLVQRAGVHSANTVSLTDLTQVVNRHCDQSARKQLLVQMWQVALADGRIDKYEEYVIRQVAGLLYVAHEDFVHARQLAREAGHAGATPTLDAPAAGA